MRKYGLAFVAALLATNSILEYIKLDNLTKFSISIITILFITVLNLIDQYYQDMSKAVSNRARVLETIILNTELDEMISYQFEKGNLADYIRWTYNGLIVIAVAVGVVVIVSAPNTTSTSVGNLNFSINTPAHLSDLSSISIFILKLLVLLILLLLLSIFLISPIIIKKNIGSSSELCKAIKECMKNKDKERMKNEESYLKLCENIKECFNSTRQLLWMFIRAIYYTLILFSFYYILVHLFSSKTTLSLLLLFAGCTGIYIIDVSNEIINKKRADHEKLKELGNDLIEISNAQNPDILKNAKLDWIIDRLLCESGEIVRFTVTNLGKKSIKFKSGTCVCEITSDDDKFLYQINAKKDIIVPSYENYSWFWDTSKDTENGIPPEGMYRVKPCGWNIPLRRSILIRCHCKSEIQEKH